jgi:hypothetical protein
MTTTGCCWRATIGRNRGATRGDIQAGLDDLNNPNNNFNRWGW